MTDAKFLNAPIAGDEPFGIFLKGDRTAYRSMRNAFNSAQAALRTLTETNETIYDKELIGNNAHAWKELEIACEEIITYKSKDLEAICWLCASMLHGERPFARLSKTLEEFSILISSSLEDLHPILPLNKLKSETEESKGEEIAENKLRPFIQLFGEVEGSGLLYNPLCNAPIVGDLTFANYLSYEKNNRLEEFTGGLVTAANENLSHIQETVEAILNIKEYLSDIGGFVKDFASKYRQNPPNASYLESLIDQLISCLKISLSTSSFVWPVQHIEETVELSEDNIDGTDKSVDKTLSQSIGEANFEITADVAGRKQALIAVAKLANYFRESEPHSPICLLLDRAVRWGTLNAGELFKEILTDGSVGMSQMALMTGLESQGFSDGFSRGANTNSQILEHPTLDNYSKVLPQPQNTPAVLPQELSGGTTENKRLSVTEEIQQQQLENPNEIVESDWGNLGNVDDEAVLEGQVEGNQELSVENEPNVELNTDFEW
jgi:type VI secretion system protein ImpA